MNGRDDEIAEGGDDRDEALKGSCRSEMLNDPLWLSKGDMLQETWLQGTWLFSARMFNPFCARWSTLGMTCFFALP